MLDCKTDRGCAFIRFQNTIRSTWFLPISFQSCRPRIRNGKGRGKSKKILMNNCLYMDHIKSYLHTIHMFYNISCLIFTDFNRRCNPSGRRWENCRLGGRRLNIIWSKASNQKLVGFIKGINIYIHTIVPL